MAYRLTVSAVEVALKRVSGVIPVNTGVTRNRYEVPGVSPVTVTDATVLLARTNSDQVVPSVETSTLKFARPDVMADATQVRANEVLLNAIFEATTLDTVGLPVVTAVVVAWPVRSRTVLNRGVIRNRYEVPKVSPVTVADIAVDAVRSNTTHVVPSVETSIW